MQEPFFYTTKGEPVYMGEVYYYVYGTNPKVHSIKCCSNQDYKKGEAQFLTEQDALGYIREKWAAQRISNLDK